MLKTKGTIRSMLINMTSLRQWHQIKTKISQMRARITTKDAKYEIFMGKARSFDGMSLVKE